MRRIVIAAALVLGLQFPMGSPADAHQGLCPFTQGYLQFSSGFTDFPLGSAQTAAFAMGGVAIGCANTTGELEFLAATGIVTGWCNLAYGYGVTTRGHAFSFTVEPNRMVLLGELSGYGVFVEDPLDTGTCLNGTATRFLLSGTFAMAHGVPVPTPPLETACAGTVAIC